ncbi:MAG: hypothetical protein GY810_29180 [Aureispira sp.]|nr:hypothetical protein [Aureispira sp.]
MYKSLFSCLAILLFTGHIFAQNTEVFEERGVWETYEYPEGVCPREEFSMGWTGKEIIMFGGSIVEDEKYFKDRGAKGYYSKGNGMLFSDGWFYNPKTHKWRKMPSPPTSLSSFATDHVWTGRYLFVWNKKSSRCAFYDLEENKWTRVSTSNAPSKVLYSPGLAWTGKEIFLWGGKNYEGDEHYNDGWLYNPETNSWRKVAGTDLISARSDLACHVLNGEVVLSCGATGFSKERSFSDGAIFNPETNSWRKMADNPYHKGYTFVHKPLGKDKIYLIEEQCIYDIRKDEWEKVDFGDIYTHLNFVVGEKIVGIGMKYDNSGYVYDAYKRTTSALHSNHAIPNDIDFNSGYSDDLVFPVDDYYVIIGEWGVHHYYPKKTGHDEFSVEKGSFTDSRDDNTYQTITIDNDTWMAEDLRYQSKEGTYFCMGKENDDCSGGLLYRYSVTEEVCPAGWHLPSKEEYQSLIDYAGGPHSGRHFITNKGDEHTSTLKIKPTNLMGFNGLLENGVQKMSWGLMKEFSHYWTSTKEIHWYFTVDPEYVWTFYLSDDGEAELRLDIRTKSADKHAATIRCKKD